MKHIEENFITDKRCHLYDPELKILNHFLEELKNNESVEGISIMPTLIQKEEGRFCSIKLIVYARGNSEDFNNIQNEVNSLLGTLFYKKYKVINSFNIEVQDAALLLELKDQYNELYGKTLVSSYIAFDRNGIISELQDEASDIIKPWNSIIEIDNIDELRINQKVFNKTREN